MITGSCRHLLLCLLLSLLAQPALAGDWVRFRGPNGSGISPDETPTPVTWSDSENLKWKLELPGPGHSSPIVVGDRVFVTYWSGYGLDAENPGEQEQLKRHLLCVNRQDGTIRWDRTVDAELPEDSYGGNFAQHGYATHTPVSDGERVFVFFGKSGVLAFDMEGNQLWQTNVGSDLDPRRWGSSSSPILHEDLVIVPAVVESHSLIALDKETGNEVWKAEAEGFGNTWGTPIVVDAEDGRKDIVLAVPAEIWAFDPATGKLRWYCEAIDANSICSSVIAHEGIVYAMESGPGGGGSIAVRVGDKGDVSGENIVWSGQDRNRIATPVQFDGRLYWVAGRVANCIDANTGARKYQSRLEGGSAPPESENREGGRRGRRGPGGGQDYSSPVVADGKLYYVCRNGDMFVLALGDNFKQLAVNRFAADNGDFSATPAIADGELFIRSTKNLYCVADK